MKKFFISQSHDYNCGYQDGYNEAVDKAAKWVCDNYWSEASQKETVEDFKQAMEELVLTKLNNKKCNECALRYGLKGFGCGFIRNGKLCPKAMEEN